MITTHSGTADGMVFAAAQAVGDKSQQEDAFGHFDAECFIVADGISSCTHGKQAAESAVENGLFAHRTLRLKHFYWRARAHLVSRLFRSISHTVYRRRTKEQLDVGTTVLIACFTRGWWWVGSVGDSRAYRLSGDTFEQITTDHALPTGQLTRWIGGQKFVPPDQFGGELFSGDAFLLATDGLLRGTSAAQIHKALAAASVDAERLTQQVRRLVADACAQDARDNITAAIIKKP